MSAAKKPVGIHFSNEERPALLGITHRMLDLHSMQYLLPDARGETHSQ